jgi:hypothetical protein
VWPTVGLKVTAASHQKLAARIKAALDAGPAEDIPLREENLALRAALRSAANNEEWRLKFLAAEQARLNAEHLASEMRIRWKEADAAGKELLADRDAVLALLHEAVYLLKYAPGADERIFRRRAAEVLVEREIDFDLEAEL